jgi:ABC-type multidrug transport system fused ATPase/permease subunit
VQEAFENLVKGRTVITIAHRLSTIQKADRIIMIQDGAVIEQGTFSELSVKENGKFRLMIEKQLQEEAIEERLLDEQRESTS